MEYRSINAAAPGILLGQEYLARDEPLARALNSAGGFAAPGVGAGDAVALLMRNDLPFRHELQAAPARALSGEGRPIDLTTAIPRAIVHSGCQASDRTTTTFTQVTPACWISAISAV